MLKYFEMTDKRCRRRLSEGSSHVTETTPPGRFQGTSWGHAWDSLRVRFGHKSG
jgi:hypothetical protein